MYAILRYPHGWQLAGFDDSAWQAAVAQPALSLPTVAKTTQGLELAEQKPTVLVAVGQGSYFFDFGKEIMGGIQLSVSGSSQLAGKTVILRLGESLISEHVLRFPMYTSNRYESTFTLAGGNSNFEHHEYSEFRCVFSPFFSFSRATPNSLPNVMRTNRACDTHSGFDTHTSCPCHEPGSGLLTLLIRQVLLVLLSTSRPGWFGTLENTLCFAQVN